MNLKLTYKELEKQAEFFQTFVDNSYDWEMGVDLVGEIKYISPSCELISGYSTNDFIENPKLLTQIVHPSDIEIVSDHFSRKSQNIEKSISLSYRIITKNGDIKWIEHNCHRTFDKSKKIIGYNSSNRDITERKINEKVAREQENIIQSIFRSAPTGIGVVKDRILTHINDRLCEMIGYSVNELINQSSQILYPTMEDYEYVGKEKYKQIQLNGTGTVETHFKRKDGQIIDVLLSSTPIDLEDFSKGITFTALDISKRKKAEQDLQNQNKEFEALNKEYKTQNEELLIAKENIEESEERLNSFSNVTYEAVFFTKNGICIDANSVACKMFGYDYEELIGMSGLDAVAYESKELVKSNMLSGYDLPYDAIAIRKDKTTFDGEFQGRMFDYKGERIRVTAVRDISLRKNDEKLLELSKQKIEESEDKFRKLSNLTFEGIVLHQNGIAIDINLSIVQLFGYTREEIIGKNLIKLVVKEEYHSIISQNIIKHYALPYEVVGIRKDGTELPLELEARDFETGNNTIRAAAVRDISERKKFERELRIQNEELIIAKNNAEESNERFNLAIEATTDGLWDWDLISNEIYYSPRWKAMLGYEDHELANDFSVWEKLTIEEDVKKSWDMLNKHVAGDLDKFDNELKMQHKNGHWVDISSRATVFHNEQGKAYRVVGTHTDITESKKAKLLLLKSEDRFRKLIDNMPSGVAIYKAVNNDEDFEFIDLNKKSEEITNSSKNNIIGHTLLEKFPNMKNGPFIKSLQKISKDGININLPPFFYKDAQREGWRENNIYKLASGEIVAIFKDVTDIKEVEEQLKKQNVELLNAKEKAEESNRLKTEFINNMSHEIRTPLNGILGFSKFLDIDNLSAEKRKNYISIIHNSGHQLMHIIDDILEISRLGTKQVKIIEEEICLNDLLLENFSIFDIKAKENNTPLYLRKDLSDQESLILTDGTKMNKILGNLLENALKFTNQGFVELGYNLISTSKSSEIEIYVKDTGIGIKPESQEIIFERFSQEEKSLSRNVGGLGLGLSIAKENAELLGGKIRVESEKDKGSTFFITIPYKTVNIQLNENMLGDKGENLPEKHKKQTILIVEDEEVNYLFLETLINLFDTKVKILHAKHGKESLEICKKNPEIDIVLMDLKMPIMSGFEATKLIKEYRPDLLIVAQTAYSTPEEKQQALSAGCDDFISKPINKEVLFSMLKEYLHVKE